MGNAFTPGEEGEIKSLIKGKFDFNKIVVLSASDGKKMLEI